PREGTRSALREYTLGLNQLIAGQTAHPRVWSLVERHLPAGSAARYEPHFKAHFHPLWSREDLANLKRQEPEGLLDEWRRRAEGREPWSSLSGVVRQDHDASGTWQELEVGDFDLSGRGRDYTAGMEYFQAARAFGIEGLMELLGLHRNRGGVFLDVLGGDGYIMRIIEATRKMREKRLLAIPVAHTFLETDDAAEPSTLDILLQRVLSMTETVLALLVTAPAEEGERNARLLGITPEGLDVGEPFTLSAGELHALQTERAVAWLGETPAATGLTAILRRVNDYLTTYVGTGQRPLMVTNDISPHMFYSAGLWGFPTREDARRLSRTFNAGSLDGVLFAYGTHHVTGLDEAIRESLAILRPGGSIVVHDFLDEGQVGQWFHRIVDKHSRTGHDFPHLGPLQLAVSLFLAGFRDVQLYEMEDPFVFSVPEGSPDSARDVACTYLLGMYGMTESFGTQRDRFEEILREILSYPEIRNEPLFGRDLVYVPRRSTVVSGRRPADPRAPFGDGDRSLIRKITGLLQADPGEIAARAKVPPEIEQAWFLPDGTRWGISPAVRHAWLDWAASS
ncbi:MAG: methyltransferase domain-containing protein, partial [Acidobacteriota bacterium]